VKASIRLTPDQMDEALAEALFSERGAGRPAYAMPDEEHLAAVGAHLGVPAAEARTLLLDAASLQMGDADGRRMPFARLAERLNSRPQDSLDTPPGLAAIAVLSLAADSMHAAEGMSTNNYYGRLYDLLSTPDASKNAVERGYREYGEKVWVGCPALFGQRISD
jgi:hypothetical protein